MYLTILLRVAPLLCLVIPSTDTSIDSNHQQSSVGPTEVGFVSIFNGKDLRGWKQLGGRAGAWKVEDGLLVCTGGDGHWLGTEKNYANFDLRLEYKLKPGGNSGVYLRAPDTGRISRTGIEIQILDDNDPQYNGLHFYQYTGALYHVAAPSQRAGRPAGQWNELRILAEDRRIQVWLNGKRITDVDLDRALEDPEVAQDHPGLRRQAGRIGLQSHTNRVEFRRIRIKTLP